MAVISDFPFKSTGDVLLPAQSEAACALFLENDTSNPILGKSIEGSPTTVWEVTEPYCMDVCTDNGFVYGAFDKYIRKLDPSGTEIWTFTGHTGFVNSLAIGSNGDYIYSGSSDKTVRKIAYTGDEVWSYIGHTDTIRDVVVDNDGYLYSGSNDTTLKKIDPEGSLVWTYSEHPKTVRALEIDRYGDYIYTYCFDWNMRKISSSGTLSWKNSSLHTLSTHISKDKNIYSARRFFTGSEDSTVKYINDKGNEIYSYNIGSYVEDIRGSSLTTFAYGSSVFIYAALIYGKLCKLDMLNSTKHWIYAHPTATWAFDTQAVSISTDGYVYFATNKGLVKIKDSYTIHTV